jgi:RNA exonuclease 1
VYTTGGSEVARVTIVDAHGDLLIDELLKPECPIVDYSTSFSGLTEEQLAPVTMTLIDLHRILQTYIYEETILIGHSLDNDLKALRVSSLFYLLSSISI